MTMKMLTVSAAVFLLPLTAIAAPAQPNRTDEGAIVNSDGPIRELKFDEADSVEGETLSPNGVNVGGRRAQDHANMIGIRGQFVTQLIKLSNDI
jgi:hypothetical protein